MWVEERLATALVIVIGSVVIVWTVLYGSCG